MAAYYDADFLLHFVDYAGSAADRGYPLLNYQERLKVYCYFAKYIIEKGYTNKRFAGIKAAMILVDPKCGSEYGITYKIPPAAMSIIGVLVVSILLFQMLNRTKKNVYMKSKRKVKVKQTRRKGW